jgi:hypothetical protein
MSQRKNGGMIYIQIAFALLFGVGAVVLGVAAPPPGAMQWLVLLIGVALILTGIGGLIYAYRRVRR